MTELASSRKVVGVKQSRKAIREGSAAHVYLATDADSAMTDPVAADCAARGICVTRTYTMAELGRASRITVGAAVVVVLKDS